jgi:Transposase IS116/IS110/IS902 family
VPGIGPLISSAMVAAIGNGTAFAKGRDYSAWLGRLHPNVLAAALANKLARIAWTVVILLRPTVTCACSLCKQPGGQ